MAQRGGTTAEITHVPEAETAEPFDWRLSLATIERPSPFSAYPDVDRLLMPVGAAAVTLDVAGAETLVLPRTTMSSGGEQEVSAHRPSGHVRALNLMTRRGGPVGSMTVVSHDGLVPEEGTVIVLARSDARLRTGGKRRGGGAT